MEFCWMAYHRTEMNNLFAFTSRRSIITYKLAGAESTIRHLQCLQHANDSTFDKFAICNFNCISRGNEWQLKEFSKWLVQKVLRLFSEKSRKKTPETFRYLRLNEYPMLNEHSTNAQWILHECSLSITRIVMTRCNESKSDLQKK